MGDRDARKKRLLSRFPGRGKKGKVPTAEVKGRSLRKKKNRGDLQQKKSLPMERSGEKRKRHGRVARKIQTFTQLKREY